MRIDYLNVRLLIAHFEHKLEIICLTETWLYHGISSDIVSIPDFKLYRVDRSNNDRGEGVAIYVSTKLKIKTSIEIRSQDNFESLFLTISNHSYSFVLGVIYRPPGLNISTFIKTLDDVLSSVVPLAENLIIMGDMNINLLNLGNPLTTYLNSNCANQLIDEPTRVIYLLQAPY